METLIGIYASPGEYAARLADYINSRRDVGYGGLSFKNDSDLSEFFRSNELSILLTDDPKTVSIYADRTKVYLLTEENTDAANAEESVIFKYLKAPVLLQKLLPKLKKDFVRNNVITYFAPSSNETAKEKAWEKATKMAADGQRTLMIGWDPFAAIGRETEEGTSLSELLFAFRKNRQGFGKYMHGLKCKDGVFLVKGTDFYTDLWNFTGNEMQAFVEMCRSEGNFENVIFECSFMSEAVEKLMEVSDRIYLLKSSQADPGPDEFLRQMKYAGKQDILLRIGEAEDG